MLSQPFIISITFQKVRQGIIPLILDMHFLFVYAVYFLLKHQTFHRYLSTLVLLFLSILIHVYCIILQEELLHITHIYTLYICLLNPAMYVLIILYLSGIYMCCMIQPGMQYQT